MRVRSRTVQAAGVMSVALVAAARVARDARPRRRVTCVRVPPRPSEPDAAAKMTVASAVTDGPVPAVPAEDPALWQPTAVMAAVVAPEPAPPEHAPPEAAPPEAAPPEAAPTEAAPPGTPAPEPAPPETPAPEPPPRAPLLAPELTPAASLARAREPEPAWGWAEPWSFELPAPDAPARRAPARRKPTRRTPTRRKPGPRHPSAPAARDAAHHPSRRPRRGHPVVALAVIVLAVAVSAWIVVPRSAPASAHPTVTADVSHSPHPSAFALRAIPSAYLHDYWRVAAEYGLDWTKLAAVGQIESNQGRSPAPGVAAGTNPAGAAGPAQFLGTTWARYGVDADGRGSINPYDPADAITAMAAYLKASGAPEDWRKALFTYNHSSDYVDAVLALSRRYLRP